MYYAELTEKLMCLNKLTLPSDWFKENNEFYMFTNMSCKINVVDANTGVKKCIQLKDLESVMSFKDLKISCANLFYSVGRFFMLKDFTRPSLSFSKVLETPALLAVSNGISRSFIGNNNYYFVRVSSGFDLYFDGRKVHNFFYSDGEIPVCLSKDCLSLYTIFKSGSSCVLTKYKNGVFTNSIIVDTLLRNIDNYVDNYRDKIREGINKLDRGIY